LRIWWFGIETPICRATIQIETADGHIITTGTTNKLSGEFSVSIPETNQPLKIRIQSGDNVKYYDLVISEDQREINLAYTIEKQAPEHIILFDFDSHYITQDQKVKLDKFIARIKLHPETKIHMAGHTCSDGSHEYNIELSENRAKRIYNHLAKMGIPKSQIEVAFHGAKQPSQSNGYASGRTANRRVEILVK